MTSFGSMTPLWFASLYDRHLRPPEAEERVADAILVAEARDRRQPAQVHELVAVLRSFDVEVERNVRLDQRDGR